MKRFNIVGNLCFKRIPRRDDEYVCHPCGPYAPVSYLRSRPNVSRAVAYSLQQDASFSGDFEREIIEMALRGCAVPNKVWKHLKRWRSKGCPHWKARRKPCPVLTSWWDAHSWVFLPTLSRKRSSDSDAEYRDAVDYYRDIALSNLMEAMALLSAEDNHPIDAPF